MADRMTWDSPGGRARVLPPCQCGHVALVHVLMDRKNKDGTITAIRRKCTSWKPDPCLCRLYIPVLPEQLPPPQMGLW